VRYRGKSCTRKSVGYCAGSSPLPVGLGRWAWLVRIWFTIDLSPYCAPMIQINLR
jgi:hypothetical protein